MKKTIRYLVTLIFCLSMIMATFIPAYAASVAQVKGLKATDVTYNSAVLTWTKASKVDGYEVEKYNSSSKKWTVVKNDIKSSANKYSLTKLTTGTTYKYRVRAFKKSFGRKTYGAYSATVSVKPMPAKVTGFKASAVTATTAKLTWTKVAGATGYKIQLYKDKKWTDYKTVKTNSLSITKLTCNTTYKYRIAAYRTVSKKNYVGAYSGALSVKTAVGAVTGLKISNITPTSAKATWKAVTDVTGYSVVLTDPNGKKIVSKNVTNTTYSFTNLTPKVKYTLNVTAYKTISKKNYNGKAASTTITPKIDAPTAIKTTVKPTSIAVSWTKAANAQGYRVNLYDKDGKQVKADYTTDVKYTFSGIAPGTYTVKVYSYVTASGTKYYSAALSSATLKLTLPAPTAIKTTVKPKSIAVSWTKASDAQGYEVNLYNNNSSVPIKTATTTNASCTFSDITPNSSYTVKVFSYVTISGKKYYSAALSSATLKTTVPAPTGLKVSESSSSSIELSWAAVTDASEYEVQYYTGSEWKAVATTKDLKATKSSLSANTVYKFRVRACVSASSKNYYSAFTSEFPAITLDPVSNPRVVAVSQALAAISWSPVSDANGYVVSCPGTSTQDITETSTRIAYLDPNTEYNIAVQAYKTISGVKYYSSAKTIKVKTNIAFKHLSSTNSSDYFYMDEAFDKNPKASFVLRWEDVNDAVYTVYSSSGETLANNITNNYLEITENAKTFSAKAAKVNDYKTRISWDAQSGVKNYTLQIADATSKKWITIGSYTGTSADLYLAPNTTYYARVIATKATSKTYTIYANDKNNSNRFPAMIEIAESARPQLYAVTNAFTTPKASAFNSSNDESKTLYTLWAVQALNNTKFEKGKLTVASNMDMDVSIADSTIGRGKLSYPLLEVLDNLKFFAGILGIKDLGDMNVDDLKKDLKEALSSVNESQTVTFNGGVGNMKTTGAQYIYDINGNKRLDANGAPLICEVTKTVKTTPFDFISPNSEYASFYDSQKVSNFKNKISNVKVSTSGTNTTITLTLKEENTNATKGAAGTPVHNGFIGGFSDQLSGMGGNATLKLGKGNKTEIVFVINANGTLNSYKVTCPFTLKMTQSEMGLDINMVMDGPLTFNYKFTR